MNVNGAYLNGKHLSNKSKHFEEQVHETNIHLGMAIWRKTQHQKRHDRISVSQRLRVGLD